MGCAFFSKSCCLIGQNRRFRFLCELDYVESTYTASSKHIGISFVASRIVSMRMNRLSMHTTPFIFYLSSFAFFVNKIAIYVILIIRIGLS